MKLTLKITLFALINLMLLDLQAQEDSLMLNDSVEPKALESKFEGLTKMHVSYYGSTQNCEPYTVSAIKYKRNWFLIINTNDRMSFIHINAPFSDGKIIYPSQLFIESIAKSHVLCYTKLKKKKATVNDMDIYGYYKFNKFGRKVIKGLLYLEYPYYKKGFLFWKFDREKAQEFIEEKYSEMPGFEQLETIKTEINEINNSVPIEKK